MSLFTVGLVPTGRTHAYLGWMKTLSAVSAERINAFRAALCLSCPQPMPLMAVCYLLDVGNSEMHSHVAACCLSTSCVSILFAEPAVRRPHHVSSSSRTATRKEACFSKNVYRMRCRNDARFPVASYELHSLEVGADTGSKRCNIRAASEAATP